jgi:outer membrane protein OmpA-like peptidoglycan-associated protein
MRRLSVLAICLVGVLGMAATGCVPQGQHDALKMQNRELNKNLEEQKLQRATLQERVDALQAQIRDAENQIQRRDQDLGDLNAKYTKLLSSFDTLQDAYKKLAEAGTVAPGTGGGLGGPVGIAIRKLADDYPQLFAFNAQTGILRVQGDFTFDSGSVVVKPSARAALARLAGILAGADARNIMVNIVGYTDNVRVAKAATKAMLQELGKAANNQGLSEARAEAVAQLLTSGGVPASRIVTSGRGEADPIGSNRTNEGRAQNRRVEILLRDTGG